MCERGDRLAFLDPGPSWDGETWCLEPTELVLTPRDLIRSLWSSIPTSTLAVSPVRTWRAGEASRPAAQGGRASFLNPGR